MAIVTVIVVVAGTVSTWALITFADPDDGTVAELGAASEAGAWRAVDSRFVVDDREVDGQETFTAELGDDADSWIVQISALAGDAAAEIAVVGSDAPLLIAPPGTTVTTTALLRADSAGMVSLTSSQDATVSIETVASFTRSPEGAAPFSLGPGGTLAVEPFVIVDTENGMGPPRDADGRVDVSVLGLGGVPRSGVHAVWLQVVLEGETSRLSTVNDRGAIPLVESRSGLPAQALVIVEVDDTGRVPLHFSASTTSARLAVAGWIAEPLVRLNASLIDGGIIAGAADVDPRQEAGRVVLDLPSVVVGEAVALWSVNTSGVGAELGVWRSGEPGSAVSALGEGSALVASGSEIMVNGDVDVSSVKFLGFVTVGGGAEDAPGITITTPTDRQQIDLADQNGVLTISGTVAPNASGLRRIDLRVGGRFIGTAPVRFDGDVLRWSLDMSAPPGTHEVSAVATSFAGASAEAVVSLQISISERDEPIVRPGVVVLNASSEAALVETSLGSLVFDGESPASVGDIVVAGVSPSAPSGLLRRIDSIEVRDGRALLQTSEVGFDEVFLSTDVSIIDAPVDVGVIDDREGASDDNPELASAAPANTQRATDTGPPSLALAGFDAGAMTAQAEQPEATDASAADTSVGALAGSLGSWELKAQLKFEQAVNEEGIAVSTTVSTEVSSIVNDVYEQKLRVSLPGAPSAQRDGLQTTANDGISRTTGGSITVSRKLAMFYTFVLDIDAQMRWLDPEITVRTFEASTTLETTDTTDVAVYGTLTYSSEKDGAIGQLPEIPLGGPVTFTIGVVPVVLSFSIVPTIDVSLTVSAKTSMRIQSSESVTVGVRVVDGVAEAIAERSNSRTPIEPTTVITSKAGLEVGLGLRMKAYETLSITIGIAKGLELEAEVEVSSASRASLSLVAYLELTFSAGLSVFGLKLVEWEESLRVYEDRLWDTDVGAGPTDDDTSSSVSAIDSARGDGDRVLVLVVDVSGSMGGERITEAKASLNRVVQTQQTGSELGIWTYPNNSSCGSGEFRVPPAQRSATGQLLDIIDQLDTGGQTPTGEALQAVADQLLREGRTGATILLVSDGESNCRLPPCDVAQDLQAQGFDLTVQSVGFQISEAGRSELECIAAVTGGQSYQVDDADELWPLIESMSLAEIELDVSMPSSVRAGGSAWVSVTVRNPSARDVTGVTAIVTTTENSLPAAILPTAVLELGNIPAGSEITRRLSITAESGRGVREGEIELDIASWATNASLVEREVTTKVSERPIIEPGAVFDERRVVSVGDGFGVRINGEQSIQDECARDATDAVVSVACAGALSTHILDSVQRTSEPPYARGLTQIDALGGTTAETVLVTVGAHDVGLGELVSRCAKEDCAFDDPVVQAVLVAAQLVDFSDLYERIAVRFGGAQHAQVVVSAYPALFSSGPSQCDGFSSSEAQVINTVVGLLNASIESSVLRAAESGAPVHYLATPVEALRPDLTLCSTGPGLDVSEDGRITLSERGARAMTDSILIASVGRDVMETVPDDALTGDSASLDPLVTPEVTVTINADNARGGTPAPLGTIVKPLQQVLLLGDGYQPGSLVFVSLTRDTSIPIAVGRVDDGGAISLLGTVPATIPAGAVEFTVYGVGAGGEVIEASASASVGAPIPDWVLLLGVASIVLALAALVLLFLAVFLGRRRRHNFTSLVHD